MIHGHYHKVIEYHRIIEYHGSLRKHITRFVRNTSEFHVILMGSINFFMVPILGGSPAVSLKTQVVMQKQIQMSMSTPEALEYRGWFHHSKTFKEHEEIMCLFIFENWTDTLCILYSLNTLCTCVCSSPEDASKWSKKHVYILCLCWCSYYMCLYYNYINKIK